MEKRLSLLFCVVAFVLAFVIAVPPDLCGAGPTAASGESYPDTDARRRVETKLLCDYRICSNAILEEAVIRNEREFKEIWEKVMVSCLFPPDIPDDPPYVDFSKFILLGWTYERPNSCWSGKYLRSARYTYNYNIEVVLEQLSPGEGCNCLMVYTRHAVFYLVKRPVNEVKWFHIEEPGPPCK